MNITNVKIHVRVKEKIEQYCDTLLKSDKTHKKTSSFVILRLPPFVYTCFFTGFINITGIQTLDLISTAIDQLKDQLNIKYPLEPTIDTVSSCWPKSEYLPKFNLLCVKAAAGKHPDVKTIKYNRERFPALFTRTKFGTILWFATPAIVAVGSKEQEDMTRLKSVIDTILQNT